MTNTVIDRTEEDENNDVQCTVDKLEKADATLDAMTQLAGQIPQPYVWQIRSRQAQYWSVWPC